MFWKKVCGNRTAKIGFHKHFLIRITIIICMMAKNYAFIGDEAHHKKVIIHVPVVTRTIYKVIEKGSHKHGGEVHHHHHHGGHVAHIHKHEGEAAHKHHHMGHAAHLHKHAATAAHKHVHLGKGDHAHIHKGHSLNDHIHKGIYGHDHKHAGAFSNAHAHSGAGLHSHGHLAESIPGHGQLNYFQSLPNIDNPYASWMAYQSPSPPPPPPTYHKFDQNINNQPYNEGWSPQYNTPYVAYPTEGDYRMRPMYLSKGPSSAYNSNFSPDNSNEYEKGEVTTYSVQNSKQVVNTEYEEQPKGKKRNKKIKTVRYGILTPQLSAELDETLHSMHAIDEITDDSFEDGRLNTSVPEDSHESYGYDEAKVSMSSEEGDMGYQSQMKAQVTVPLLKRIGPKHVAAYSYEVTEPTLYN